LDAQTFKVALSEGHSGILVTVNPDHSYTLELGNLMAGESCAVRLRYVQILQPEQGSLRLMLPTTIAPRYGDAVSDGGFELHAAQEVSATAEYAFSIEINIQGELVQAQIGSPSHRITTRTLTGVGTNEGLQTQVKLGEHAWLDRDFVLVFSELLHSSQGLATWDHLNEGSGVVMASFTPRLTNQKSIPASMKVLVDCSGSMNGDSIQAARSALQSILSALNADDRFSLSRFGSSVEHRSKALWKVAPASMASAQRWVQTLEADLGGTEMNDAILSTLAIPGVKHCDVLLITDGEIQSIEPVLKSAKNSGHRFFVVGIGSAVAEGLLRRLAEDTGGSCEFVVGGEHVSPAIQRLFHRLRSPSVQQARIEWPENCAVRATSELPASIFEGDDITVFAQLKSTQTEALTSKVRLLGRIADTQEEICLAEFTPALVSDDASTLARLAANQRYWQLRKGSENSSTVATEELRALAEKYQLVTDDTSLILVKQREAHELAQEMPRLKAVNSMLAAGWGGHGSVEDTQVMFSIAVPDPRFCADALSPAIGRGAALGIQPRREQLLEFADFVRTPVLITVAFRYLEK
jgi:Ca-activated chloride channel family protein